MIYIKKLSEDVKTPIKGKIGDAGFDVFSLEDKILAPRERYRFKLGFCVEFPEGHVLFVNERSGMALNEGVITMANVIDSKYRGEISVLLINLGDETVIIRKDQKIAQVLLLQCYTGREITEVKELTPTERGTNGFGSTGKF